MLSFLLQKEVCFCNRYLLFVKNVFLTIIKLYHKLIAGQFETILSLNKTMGYIYLYEIYKSCEKTDASNSVHGKIYYFLHERLLVLFFYSFFCDFLRD